MNDVRVLLALNKQVEALRLDNVDFSKKLEHAVDKLTALHLRYFKPTLSMIDRASTARATARKVLGLADVRPEVWLRALVGFVEKAVASPSSEVSITPEISLGNGASARRHRARRRAAERIRQEATGAS